MTTIQKIAKRSEKAISTIYNLIDSLKEANEEIKDEIQYNTERIELIKQNSGKLEDMKKKNERVITNFENLLK